MRGQVFTDAQGEPGQEKVVVLSYGFWQRVFGGRDDAIGQDLRLGGEAYRIVGVMDPQFRFLNPDIQLYRPAAFTARDRSDDSRHSNNWQQFARLKPGATVEQAQSQVDAINAANFERFPAWREILTNAKFGTDVVDFQKNLIGDTRSTLSMLWGGALFVLLIGCVNVANLALVRSTARPVSAWAGGPCRRRHRLAWIGCLPARASTSMAGLSASPCCSSPASASSLA